MGEMGILTEPMQGLQEAVKHQTHQLTKFDKNRGLKETPEVLNNEFIQLHTISQLSDEQLERKLERQIHSTGSDISEASHWSCSLDSIASSIGYLKHILKNQDKNVIWLMTENEELKRELSKREKELRKQRFVLKAERTTFEQYKRDTFNELKRHNSEESPDVIPDRSSREMTKLKSELAHYRQMYIEMDHTVDRLTKLVSSLKDDKTQLKNKLLQQEKRSNKYIYDMAQRFDISRKDLNMIISRKFETVAIPATNLAMCKIADRNARLAYDNSMLKLELNMLRKKMIERKTEENKLQCFTNRSSFYTSAPNNRESSSELQKCNMLKSSLSKRGLQKSESESGLSIGLQGKNSKPVLAVRRSVTSFVERNKEQSSSQEQISDKTKNVSIFNVERWDCLSQISRLTRTESAPSVLNTKHNKGWN